MKLEARTDLITGYMPKVVLTIGGSDSGGGAGIQADIKTFSVLGLHGTSAITAITAQNTMGVQHIYPLPPEQVRAQLTSITEDFSIAWAKTGMLHSAQIVDVVADHLSANEIPLVLDPVIEAEAGGRLLRPEAVSALIDHLIPIAGVVTPNIFEAEALTGIAVCDMESAAHAARNIMSLGAQAVIIKGGHLDCTDLLMMKDRCILLPSERIPGENHGIGCTFSAALTSFLAGGCSLEEAARRAKEFAKSALRGSLRLGRGVGPVNQSAAQRAEASRYRVLCDLERAMDRLEENPDLLDLMAEEGTGPAMAIPGASCLEDVAELKGGVARIGDKICRRGGLRFGEKSDKAAVILAAMRIDPQARAALELAPSALSLCRESGFLIMDSTVGNTMDGTADSTSPDKMGEDGRGRFRGEEGSKGRGLSREAPGHLQAGSTLLPIAIWDEGIHGKGPRLYLLGSSASSLIELAARMSGSHDPAPGL
ncbi:MAG TPA: bifunctional hydroxymethylpyrimidine kinase/phosphomethylpyrimidine kinase [Methanothrix sp.]|uniref:bifunctional hydroxymethylpyrimidine kinase/phosphomethylpyrimidine kinase n=1 Tax=Methanothrix sp. TaxID=90426 RepID=UPI002BDF6D54|nr:bifunctional hydroxymethylpyrimidine kinase/phosphomethylpyrimidine kinase [Methanothrix sp.]MDI9417327.1 bifunctional hydroxymethylpyrimidine kinase/phosphomethylpyrimidine kinase [Euryarchaeota archaeon]HON35220.1 bifunctional hydroxymethylpyrimidine kinase/phosphomethylpyrimidine kinase [Methanothrix sp.]HRU75183.1 bifunctional hydroxymethylpyrimidine kinase/phosphomethylpyrimidine kinase [Methanothrix sp.]